MPYEEKMKVGIAQISPVWLNRQATLEKVVEYIEKAAKEELKLLVFGETLVPGYPFWLDKLDGARFESERQKTIFAHYSREAVQIESGHLDEVCALAKTYALAIYLGVVEKPASRGGHSLYCSLVYIDPSGEIGSVHRKLMPTYEERLVWGIGDGHGLVTHELAPFRVGGLNCWENWMPLARTALYKSGEDLHVSVWPGHLRLTEKLIPMLALEGRSYVMAASGVLTASEIGEDFPYAEEMRDASQGFLADGGSCIAAPDGSWLVAPVTEKEALLVAELDHQQVRQARQNFDPVGHYSRPDVLQLAINRERQ
jgi:nitrilase